MDPPQTGFRFRYSPSPNSYSRQHPLYRALKELGKIEKSLFLLTWIDLVDLRQAVEKQLNKGESANRFAEAICFCWVLPNHRQQRAGRVGYDTGFSPRFGMVSL